MIDGVLDAENMLGVDENDDNDEAGVNDAAVLVVVAVPTVVK